MQVFFWKRSPCKCICIKGSLTNNSLFIANYALRVFSSNLPPKEGFCFCKLIWFQVCGSSLNHTVTSYEIWHTVRGQSQCQPQQIWRLYLEPPPKHHYWLILHTHVSACMFETMWIRNLIGQNNNISKMARQQKTPLYVLVSNIIYFVLPRFTAFPAS